MKAFKVFWKDGKPTNKIVVARDFNEALAIAATYGEVNDIGFEGDVITERKSQ